MCFGMGDGGRHGARAAAGQCSGSVLARCHGDVLSLERNFRHCLRVNVSLQEQRKRERE